MCVQTVCFFFFHYWIFFDIDTRIWCRRRRWMERHGSCWRITSRSEVWWNQKFMSFQERWQALKCWSLEMSTSLLNLPTSCLPRFWKEKNHSTSSRATSFFPSSLRFSLKRISRKLLTRNAIKFQSRAFLESQIYRWIINSTKQFNFSFNYLRTKNYRNLSFRYSCES